MKNQVDHRVATGYENVAITISLAERTQVPKSSRRLLQPRPRRCTTLLASIAALCLFACVLPAVCAGQQTATTVLNGPVGINTPTAYGMLDVFGGVGTNFIYKEISTGQVDYSYNYLKLFKLTTGSGWESITLNATICATRSDDIGATQCAQVHVSRNWDSRIFFSEMVQASWSYGPFQLVSVNDAGSTWVSLLYDTHTGAGPISWTVSGTLFDWDDDPNAVSLTNLTSLTPIHSALQSLSSTTSIPLGYFGIGTISPTSPLEVNGNITLTQGSGASIMFPDGSSLSSAASLNQLGLTGGGTPAITQANGNVGIGTTNPAANLDVHSIIRTTSPDSLQDINIESGDYSSGLNAVYSSVAVGANIQRASRISFPAFGGYTGIGLDINNSQFGAGADPSTVSGWTNVLTVNPSGNVGIGTTNPQALLDVDGAVRISGSGAGLTFPDGSVQSTAYTGTCPSTGGDYAESVDVEGDKKSYEPGDVMVIDPDHPGHFLMSSEPYSPLVAGIYSTKPGYVGRRQTTNPKLSTIEIPMAMVGIVPTKVTTENGPIKVGDLLVTSSKPGYVMKGTDHDKMTGTIVGKALASLKSDTGVIEVLVSLQ